MKVVINSSWGGYGLSMVAILRYAELSGFKVYCFLPDDERDEYYKNYDVPDICHKCEYYGHPPEDHKVVYSTSPLGSDGRMAPDSEFRWNYIERTDPILVKVVEELGRLAHDDGDELVVVSVPDDVEWEITYNDGLEEVVEVHRVWSG